MVTGPQYKRTSAAVLILAIAGLTLPLFHPLLARLAPLGQCASLTLFGKPCPMCGLTRGFYSIWHLDLSYATELNLLSLPLFAFFILEALFRAMVVLKIDRTPRLISLTSADARIHIALVAAYFLYAVIFILLEW